MVWVAAPEAVLPLTILPRHDAETPAEELRHRIDEARETVRRRQAVRDLYSRINERVRVLTSDAAPSDARRHQHHALAERYLAAVLSHAPDALIAVAFDGEVVSWNEAASHLFGRSWDEIAGQSFADLFALDDRLRALSVLNRVALGESVQGQELRIASAEDRVLTLEISAGPVLGGGRAIEGISLTARNVTERKQSEEHQQLLINELNHRVKNTLTTVRSIASQTLRNAETTDEARHALEERLFALSRAHNVLTQQRWEGANLSDIVDQALAPYRHSGRSRLHASGADVRLPPATALAVAMLLHELSTNAVRYGALSNETGEVRITWGLLQTSEGQYLHLTWTEAGGPPVRVPTRRGFGTRLIECSLAQDLGGEVKLEFEPPGLVCTISALVRNA